MGLKMFRTGAPRCLVAPTQNSKTQKRRAALRDYSAEQREFGYQAGLSPEKRREYGAFWNSK